jgi:uncharacterized membrane protein
LDELAFLAIVIVLALLAVPVCLVVLFLRTARLKDQIAMLEQRFQARAVLPEVPDDSAVAATPMTAPATPIVPDIAPAANAAGQTTTAWDKALGKTGAAANLDTGPAQVAGPETDFQDHDTRTLRPGLFDTLSVWLRTNWIYAVSAASLGLAGIFFVQYGMERGLLPPSLRVIMAILFGAALIAAGEWLRRRHGDEGETATAHLPSVFSGAGLVSIFAALLAARHLYGLITPEVAFAGHLVTAALAVALGWFYGPLLAAVGLIGAALSPFVVGGGSDAAPWLYAYFALIAAVGLGIDAVRQWRWVSLLALCLGYAGALLMWPLGAGDVGWAVFLGVMAIMAVVIPPLSLTPRHTGPFMLQTLLGQAGKTGPAHSVRLACGAAIASCAGLLMMTDGGVDAPLLAAFVLTVLALLYLIWAEKAQALADLALIPAIGLLLTLSFQAVANGQLFRDVQDRAIALRAPETSGPTEVTLLVIMALAISAAAAWRALRRQDWLCDLMFGLIAVLTAPVAVAILELLWTPAPIIGLPYWAAHIIAVAALMTALATRFAAADQGDMRRAAYATLSALSLIALALFLMTTATALTLALAVLVVVAAALDRRFNLPEMGLFQQIGVAVLSYRLLFDPGLEWAIEGPLLQVVLAFAGSIAAMVVAWVLILPHRRNLTRAVLESAAAGLTAIFVDLMLLRWLIPDLFTQLSPSHWQFTLWAMPWLVLMLAQLYRARASETLRRLRLALATASGLIATAFLAMATVPFNPLFAVSPSDLAGLVQGPVLLNSLFLAYGVPGLILLVVRTRMAALDPRLSTAFFITGLGLLSLYATLAIRHIWQGAWIGGGAIAQGELYSYTLALMALGASLLFQAIRKGSPTYRRMAMGVIGLVIAKVFLIDAAGLTGLTRVFSFLGLGLSLAGLAWLNRWAEQAAAKES